MKQIGSAPLVMAVTVLVTMIGRIWIVTILSVLRTEPGSWFVSSNTTISPSGGNNQASTTTAAATTSRVFDDSSSLFMIPGLILPHGDFAYDPFLVTQVDNDDDDNNSRAEAFQAAYQIAVESRRAAKSFWKEQQQHEHRKHDHHQARASNRPDTDTIVTSTTILVLTPHGIQLETDFGLYLADTASGTAVIGQDLHNHNQSSSTSYNLTLDHLPLDLQASQELLAFLKGPKNNSTTTLRIEGIHPYNDAMPMPLNWAEIIPLTILQQELKEDKDEQGENQGPMGTSSSSWNNNNTKFMILSMPHRRYQHAADMVPELLQLGEQIAEWMMLQQHQHQKQQNRRRRGRFAVLISGDLSHTHQASGPYGYSNTSTPFDLAIGQWASNPLNDNNNNNNNPLLTVARQLQPTAKSCGFSGFVIWQGMLQYQQQQQEQAKLQQQQQQRLKGYQSETGAMSLQPPVWKGNSMVSDNHNERLLVSQLRGVMDKQKTRHPRRPVLSFTDTAGDSSSGMTSNRLDPTLYVNRNVTYYGMMAATHFWTKG